MNKGSEKHTIEEWVNFFETNDRLYFGSNLTDGEKSALSMFLSLTISYYHGLVYMNRNLDSCVMLGDDFKNIKKDVDYLMKHEFEFNELNEVDKKIRELAEKFGKLKKQNEKQANKNLGESNNDVVYNKGKNEESVDEEKNNKEIKHTEKSKKLLEKVDILCSKIQKEKSPFKRQLLAIKLRSLKQRIDKEIEIQKIKETKEKEREDLILDKESKERQREKDIAKETRRIRQLYQDINSYSDYNYGTQDFLYDQNTVNKYGGIDGLIDNYKNSGDSDLIDAASKIEKANEIKMSIKTAQNELSKTKEYNVDKEFKESEKKINKEEKALIKKEKGNIFQRIGAFFKNIKQGIKEYREEKKAIKEEINKMNEKKAQEFVNKEKQTIKKDYKYDIKDWTVGNPKERNGKAQEQEHNMEHGED